MPNGNHFIYMLYVLNLPNVICKLYHNKAGKKSLAEKKRSKLTLTKFLFIYLYYLLFNYSIWKNWGFPGGWVVKNLPACRRLGSGRSPGGRSGYLLQCSCLGNPMDRAGRATVHGVARVRHEWVTNQTA